MIKSIYFLLSFFICFFFLFKKKKFDFSLSFSNSIILCYITQLCIGAIGVFPIIIFSLPVNLVSLSIIYNIVSIILSISIYKTKEYQTYHFDKFDFANFFIMFTFIGIIFIRVFSFDIRLAYFNTDIANHFDYAMSILKTQKLNTMYFASLNNAVFIDLLSPIFSGVDMYKSMIIAETVSHFLSGMIFYILISYKKRTKLFYYISPILMILYFVGWPLYEYILGGFVYWGIGVTLFLFGLYLLYLYTDFSNKRTELFISLLAVSYCIGICYVLFLPYVLALYLLCYIKITQKSLSLFKIPKRIILSVSLIGIIGIVFLIIFLYLFFGDFGIFTTFLARDGGIHKELYRDYIYFIPFLCYWGSQYKKDRTFNLNYFCLQIYLIFIIISCFLCLMGIISPYYYYKFYFILWALVWITTCDTIDLLLPKPRSWIYSYSCILLLLLAFTFTPLENIFLKKGLIQNTVVEFPLYSAVGSYLKNPRETIFDDEDYWEMMHYLDENNIYAPIITDSDYYYWYHSFFDVMYYTSDIFNTNFYDLSDIFVVDKNCKNFSSYSSKLDFDYEIIFENSFGAIYSKK